MSRTCHPPADALRLVALALFLVAGSALAQESREQAAHVHGTTTVTLALVSGTLQLELSAPGMDLVGFEHAPRDAGQEQAIAAATASLGRSGDWLAFEPAGSCTVTEVDAHTHGFGPAAAADATPADGAAAHGGHDHADGHGSDHDHDDHAGHDHDGGHGEFHLELTGTCSVIPDALRIELGARFPGIEQIRVDLITDSVQDRVELGAGQTRVPLAR
jgi:hypothetical protein